MIRSLGRKVAFYARFSEVEPLQYHQTYVIVGFPNMLRQAERVAPKIEHATCTFCEEEEDIRSPSISARDV